MRTNVDGVVAAVALFGTITLSSPEVTDYSIRCQPVAELTWAMNDGNLPVAFGGPLRLRVPRQLGYKSVKFVTRLMVTDSPKRLRLGSRSEIPE